MGRLRRMVGILMVGAVALAGANGAVAQTGPGGEHGPAMAMDPASHYIEWMIPHHEDAITMASFASNQAEHPELQGLAAHISQTQTAEIGLMRQWYQTWYGTEVPAMEGGMMHMMGGHEATSVDGARPFDKAFIEGMIPHHEMAVMGSKMALQRVERPELRDLLQSIITSQSAEIAQMRAWYQDWYGVPVPQTEGMGSHSAMRDNGAAAGQQMDHARMMGGASHQAMMGGMAGTPSNHSDGHQTAGSSTPAAGQQITRERGSSVMPFDLNQTIHRFQVLPDGALQTVTANDPGNRAQITLIQQHLADLSQWFQLGDFSAPATLHGADMPGLSELAAAAGASRLEVVYTALRDGAQLRYISHDAATQEALQRWFAAQLADHGADATSH